MKIQLKQILPNPFHDPRLFHLVPGRVEALKTSIRSTGFWDNLLVRVKPDDVSRFEIAYGHHRLEALRQLVNESLIDDEFELEFPVRRLDDATMVRIMATDKLLARGAGSSGSTYAVLRIVSEFIARETRTPLNDVSSEDLALFLGFKPNVFLKA